MLFLLCSLIVCFTSVYYTIFIYFGNTKKPVNTDVYGLFQTPRVGLEPTTPRLTAACSTIELSRIIGTCPQNRT